MSFWSDIGSYLAAPLTGGASLLLKKQSDDAEAKRAGAADAWANRPDPYAGMPTAPTDVTSGVSLDRSGLNAFGAEAMRQGPSKWSMLANMQNDASGAAAYDRGLNQTKARGQEAQDQMAMSGGLTSGAGERSAASTARNALDMGQDVSKQTRDNALQIGVNDEQNRISELGQLPGMQMQAGAFDLSKADAQNTFNARNYQTQGGIWAAGKQADAQDPNNPSAPNYDDGKHWYNPFDWFK